MSDLSAASGDSKHRQLDEAGFGSYVPNPVLLDFIERYRRQRSCEAAELKVLDWGCGRGRLVLSLRQQGYQCFGVDPDPEPVANAHRWFYEQGQDASTTLQPIAANGAVPFGDDEFDIVVSDQVLEHVADLQTVATEIARISRNEGIGLHCYPAHHGLMESHLGMPLVHWLPAGVLRQSLIALFVSLGAEPRWQDLQHLSRRDKARAYEHYLAAKIFYRPPRRVAATFRQAGLVTQFVSDQIPRLRGIRYPWLRRLARHLMTNYRMCYLLTCGASSPPAL